MGGWLVQPDTELSNIAYRPSIHHIEALAKPSEVRRKHEAHGIYRRGGKRILDLALALILLVPVGVAVLLLATLVSLDGANPFFGHKRVGRNGRIFLCWKLRSMVPDAEARLARHFSADDSAAKEWAATQKLERDPRVTRIGRFLRKASLDELPQIWNVLVGEMSLVGPRPVTEQELSRFGQARDAYLSVRPGITGLWQVLGRNDLSYAQRVRLDSTYSRRFSLQVDTAIILRTVPTVLRLTGK
jgi:exopolysaccharide production protein ExoY